MARTKIIGALTRSIDANLGHDRRWPQTHRSFEALDVRWLKKESFREPFEFAHVFRSDDQNEVGITGDVKVLLNQRLARERFFEDLELRRTVSNEFDLHDKGHATTRFLRIYDRNFPDDNLGFTETVESAPHRCNGQPYFMREYFERAASVPLQ